MKLSLSPPPPAKHSTFKLWILLAITTALLFALIVVYWVLTSVSNIQIMDPRQEIRAQMAGPVKIPVQKGHNVTKGQPVLQMNAEHYKLALEQEELKLTQTEALLPAGYNVLQEAGSFAETSAARLQALTAKETALREDLNRISARESHAALEYRRLQNQAYKATTAEQKETLLAASAQANAEYERCAREASKAKIAFEEVSLARATVELERKRMETLQRESGSNTIPESTRIRLYTVQKAKRDQARADYEAALVVAQYSGVVEDVFVTNGQNIEIGQPVMLLAPTHDFVLVVTAETFAMNVPSAFKQVKVAIPAYSDKALPGIITAIVPAKNISGLDWLDAWLPESLREVRLIIEVPITEPGPIIPLNTSVSLDMTPEQV